MTVTLQVPDVFQVQTALETAWWCMQQRIEDWEDQRKGVKPRELNITELDRCIKSMTEHGSRINALRMVFLACCQGR